MEDIQFAGNASMFLVDPEGKILLVGDEEDRFLLAHNLFDGCDNFIFSAAQKEELKKNLRDGMSGQLSFRQNDKIQYAVYMPSGVRIGRYSVWWRKMRQLCNMKRTIKSWREAC